MQIYPDTPSVEAGEFMPSCVVGGVNVITGNVVHHDEAFRINTIQPLVMDHYFSKQVLYPSTLFDGWQLGSISRMSKIGDNHKNNWENVTLVDARNGNYSFWIDDPVGGGSVSSRIHEESSKGSTNCSFGEPSGLSYMPGSKFFRYQEDVYITLPWNEEKKYHFPKGPFGYLYESRMPTGYIVKQNFNKETSYYQNLYTRNGLKLAEILGKMSGLTINFGTSDGQSATYAFRLATAKHDIIPAMRPGDKDIHIVENHILLDHVTSSSAERVDYRYKLLHSLSGVYSRAHYLTEILYEGGRFRNFFYPIEEGGGSVGWKKDAPSLGRVVEVKEPLSSKCATPVTAYRFEYARASGQKNSIFGECHSVKVYDAENKLTYFFYDSVHKRLREVHRTGKGSQGLIQRLGWKEHSNPQCRPEEKGVLLANYIRENLPTTLVSADGGSFYAGAAGREGLPPSWRLFLYGYDEKYNVISKKIVGHLTGNKDPFVLPYCDKDTTLEAPEIFDIYETTYTYYPNRLLQSETTPDGITTHYTYFAETSMPSSKLVSYDGKVQERSFYFYNDFGYLVKTVEDDGCGTTPQDMQGAAVRIETLYTPSFAGVSSGRPARVEKFMVDPLTAQRTSLGAEEYT